MLQISERKVLAGVSSGTTTLGEAADLRDAPVWVFDLWEVREAVEGRVEVLPGILKGIE